MFQFKLVRYVELTAAQLYFNWGGGGGGGYINYF